MHFSELLFSIIFEKRPCEKKRHHVTVTKTFMVSSLNMNKLNTVFVQPLDLIFSLTGLDKVGVDKIIQKLDSLFLI